MSTNPSLALQHLYMVRTQQEICRAQVDLAIASLEAVEGPSVAGCQHPEEKRVDATVMGGDGPRWKCALCDREFAGEV